MTGLATDYCVYHTADDARSAGFRVIVVEDACRGVDAAPDWHHAAALARLAGEGARIARAAEFAA